MGTLMVKVLLWGGLQHQVFSVQWSSTYEATLREWKIWLHYLNGLSPGVNEI